jgi:flagellar capping protein FliD
MATGKGGASGARVSLVFGTAQKPVKGKKTTVQLVAKVSQSTIDALSIKFKKAASGQAPKIVPDKAKRKRLSSTSTAGTKSAKRSLRCSVDGVKFHSVIVPTGMGYGQAIVNLTAQSKARVFKTPAGTVTITGDIKKKAPAKTK